jgi:predicted molibdopterin-dependent oxidoreductase YjgC
MQKLARAVVGTNNVDNCCATARRRRRWGCFAR